MEDSEYVLVAWERDVVIRVVKNVHSRAPRRERGRFEAGDLGTPSRWPVRLIPKCRKRFQKVFTGRASIQETSIKDHNVQIWDQSYQKCSPSTRRSTERPWRTRKYRSRT